MGGQFVAARMPAFLHSGGGGLLWLGQLGLELDFAGGDSRLILQELELCVAELLALRSVLLEQDQPHPLLQALVRERQAMNLRFQALELLLHGRAQGARKFLE